MIRSAASTAAFAMKLLTLRRSDAAAWSTSIRSSSVRYTNVFLPNGSLDRRRDFGEGPFFMAEIVHRRNGETNDGLGYPERLRPAPELEPDTPEPVLTRRRAHARRDIQPFPWFVSSYSNRRFAGIESNDWWIKTAPKRTGKFGRGKSSG